jgi:hypothetical protein
MNLRLMRLIITFVLSCHAAFAMRTDALPRAKADSPIVIEPAVALIENEYMSAGVDNDGQMMLVVRDTFHPREILEGNPDAIWSNITLVRVITAGGDVVISLREREPISPPERVGDVLQTTWRVADGIVVTQSLRLAINPFTLLPTLLRVDYTAYNGGPTPARVGFRPMFDIRDEMSFGEDYSTYPVYFASRSSLGAEISRTVIYSTADLPYTVRTGAYGFGDGYDISMKTVVFPAHPGTPLPDRLEMSNWRPGETWQFDAPGSREITDLAIYMYWDPVEIAPGGSLSRASAIGLHALGGVSQIATPMMLVRGTNTFDFAYWKAGESPTQTLTLRLPDGMWLADGAGNTRTLSPTVDDSNGHFYTSWRVVFDPLRFGSGVTIQLDVEDQNAGGAFRKLQHHVSIGGSPLRVGLPFVARSP